MAETQCTDRLDLEDRLLELELFCSAVGDALGEEADKPAWLWIVDRHVRMLRAAHEAAAERRASSYTS